MSEEKPKKKGQKKGSGNYEIVHFKDYVSPRTNDSDANKKYVTWGENNSFYKYLKELYLNSTTNNSCINGINKLVYGQGIAFASETAGQTLANFLSEKDLKKLAAQYYKYNKITIQVEYGTDPETKERVIEKAFFVPAEKIAMGKKDDEGEVTTYFYSDDFSQTRKEKFKPVPIPAFGLGSAKGSEDDIEIYFHQEDLGGEDYFAPVFYHGGIQYAESEIEQSNYHLNHLKNGFTTNAVINFNNGVPSPEQRDEITNDFIKTKTGSKNAGKPFITFNDGTEYAVTIASYDIPDPHSQYEFIDNLCQSKLLLAHNITSPLLVGIRDTGGGLGSNANEIREAFALFEEMTLNPVRDGFLNGIRKLLLKFGISEEPFFVNLPVFDTPASPPTSNEPTMSELMKEALKKAKTEFSAKKDVASFPVMSEEDSQKWVAHLDSLGELVDSGEWEIGDVSPAADSMEDEEKMLSLMFTKLPKDGKPQEKSKDGDSGLYKIRYAYGPKQTSKNSREFCEFMVAKAKAGIVYRKEDIDKMSETGVNGQFAEKGHSTYDLFSYKGGAYCHHRWFRVVYFRKRNADGSFKKASGSPIMENDEKTTVTEARRRGVPKGKLVPKDWDKASTKPIDMPNRGKVN